MGIYKAIHRVVFKHDYGGITIQRSEKRSFISPTKPPLNIIKWRPKPKSYIPILLVPLIGDQKGKEEEAITCLFGLVWDELHLTYYYDFYLLGWNP